MRPAQETHTCFVPKEERERDRTDEQTQNAVKPVFAGLSGVLRSYPIETQPSPREPQNDDPDRLDDLRLP